ncbi:hypothetical protein [Albibacterium profundi]|uniref:Uncharacterized protein n=1 Tax=Albibacterium profundi TaxID=3134906 RepID=A0ABV5CD25_9SPHI
MGRDTLVNKTAADKHLKALPSIEPTEPRYNKETEKAIKEVKSDKATKISLENFRKELYS